MSNCPELTSCAYFTLWKVQLYLDTHKKVIEVSLQRVIWQDLKETYHTQHRAGADELRQKSAMEISTDHRGRRPGLRLIHGLLRNLPEAETNTKVKEWSTNVISHSVFLLLGTLSFSCQCNSDLVSVSGIYQTVGRGSLVTLVVLNSTFAIVCL